MAGQGPIAIGINPGQELDQEATMALTAPEAKDLDNPVVTGIREDKYIKSDDENQFERYEDVEYS